MTPDSSYKECEACGNVLILGHKKYCSGCNGAIKAKISQTDKLEKRLAAIEKRVRDLEAKK